MGEERTPVTVRAHLNQACTLLATIDLDGAAKALAAAAEALSSTGPLSQTARSEIRRNVRQAHSLLEAARTYHGEWSRRLGCLMHGYTREGQPASLGNATHWSLEA